MTPEQAALLRKAQDSLQAARLLTGQGFHDFAVSRAYYAMFYVAEALLLGEGLTFSKHSGVIAAFGQRFAKTGRLPTEYHRYLIEGEQARSAGDYNINPVFRHDQAAAQIDRAEQFITLAIAHVGPIPPAP